MADTVFVIPAAEGYRSLAETEQAGELAAMINGILSLDLSKHFEDGVGEARSLLQLGSVYARQNKPLDAFSRLSEALVLFKQHQDLQGQGQTLMLLGQVSSRLSSTIASPATSSRESVRYLKEAQELFRRAGDLRSEGEAVLQIANLVGRHAFTQSASLETETLLLEAIESYERARALFGSLGDARRRALACLGMAQAYAQLAEPLLGFASGEEGDFGRRLKSAYAALGEAQNLFHEVADRSGEERCQEIRSVCDRLAERNAEMSQSD